MRIVFDPDFDAGHWPGPLVGRDAAAGEEWVGAGRFAGVLETALGLPAPRFTAAERAARLVPHLREREGFWSRSAEADPFGSARRLLVWRDTLAMGGWNGEAREARLAALGALASHAAPGLPDRLAAILATLARRGPGIREVALGGPRADLAPAWRSVLEALERHGTHVGTLARPEAAATGDLAAARGASFAPAGDGTLTLLRPAGPMQAAEEVAAWLAAREGDDARTVIVGACPLLDAALHRHGLPTSGPAYERRDGALLQLLPLVLEMGWAPPDPQRAYELLALRPSPVPWEVARALRTALRNWPAVGSDDWREGLVAGLAEVEGDARHARARERLENLFRAEASREGGLPAMAVLRRAEDLRRWLNAVAQGDDPPAGAGAASAQCEAFVALVRASGLDAFTPPLLHRLVREAKGEAPGDAPFAAQAGPAHVGGPGAILGAAGVVVWWGFDHTSVEPVRRLPLAPAERAELVAAGVELADPAHEAAGRAARWRRPLECATQALLLVCPERDEAGQPAHPHPLWDEVLARIAPASARRAAATRLERRTLETARARVRREALALPAPRRTWRVQADRLAPRSVESPSGLDALLGCPFQWALRYTGRLREMDSPLLEDRTSTRLLGSLVHHVLNRLLERGRPAPEDAATQAGAIFDDEAPRRVASLWLPGAETVRAQVRRAAMASARAIATLMRAAGTPEAASEQARSLELLGGTFEGRPDLVLAPTPRIVDLKWGGASYRRDLLADGAATQLASYARLMGAPGGFPPVAFFILATQRLLTTDGEAFPGAELVPGDGPEVTWARLEEAHRETWAQLREGRLEARGVPTADGDGVAAKSAVADGRLELAAPCRFCAYGALCGVHEAGGAA